MEHGRIAGMFEMSIVEGRSIEDVEGEWYGTWQGSNEHDSSGEAPRIAVTLSRDGLMYEYGDDFQCGMLGVTYDRGEICFTTGFYRLRMRMGRDGRHVTLGLCASLGSAWYEVVLHKAQ